MTAIHYSEIMQIVPTTPPVTPPALSDVNAPAAAAAVRPVGDDPRALLRRRDAFEDTRRPAEVMVERAGQDRRRRERRQQQIAVMVDTRAPLPRRILKRRAYDPTFSVSLFA